MLQDKVEIRVENSKIKVRNKAKTPRKSNKLDHKLPK